MTFLPPSRCPKLASLETFDPRWRVLDSVAVILARSCPEWSLEIADAPAVDGQPAYTLRLNRANGTRTDVRRYVIGRETGDWLSLLEVLERMPIHGDEALLQRLVTAPDDTVSRYAMIELHRRRIRPSQEVRSSPCTGRAGQNPSGEGGSNSYARLRPDRLATLREVSRCSMCPITPKV